MKEQIHEFIEECNDEETLLFIFMLLYRQLAKDSGKDRP